MTHSEAVPIEITYPDAADLQLKIAVGACKLRLEPGAGDNWVSGSYHDPTGELAHKISEEGGTVKITQERNIAALFSFMRGTPVFDLRLGSSKTFKLTLETGASECQLDLGGLPLSRVNIKQGAGKLTLDFSVPNSTEMNLLRLATGAGELELKNLANANFAEMSLEGGAASYKLDFGGDLQRSAHVKIATGMSSVALRLPANTAAKISAESVLAKVEAAEGFSQKQGGYYTSAALEGVSPLLTIESNIALGALSLRLA